MSAPSIAKTIHKASDFMIEALEDGGGFAALCFGRKPPLQTHNAREFIPFVAGDITPEHLLQMALSLLFEANARLHFLGRDRLLDENEQRAAQEIRALVGSLEFCLGAEVAE
jgi:hypothetical protein